MTEYFNKVITFITSSVKIFFTLAIVLSIPITIYLLNQPQDLRQQAQTPAEFHIFANSNTVQPGQQLILSISVNSSANEYRAAKLQLSYPNEKLEIQEVDSSKTAFPLQVENITGNGLIQISREADKNLLGNNNFILLKFNVFQESTIDEITVLPNSSVTGINNQLFRASSKIVNSSDSEIDTSESLPLFARFEDIGNGIFAWIVQLF